MQASWQQTVENVSGSAQDFWAGASFIKGYGDKNRSHDRLLGLTFRGADIAPRRAPDPKLTMTLAELDLVVHVR